MILVGGLIPSDWLTASGLGLLFLQVWYTVKSVKTVNIDEQALLLLFGKPIKTVRPGIDGKVGLVYVAYKICKLLRAPTGIIEKDVPADPRFIWHGDATKGDGRVPVGFFPPIRVTFATLPDELVKVRSPFGPNRTIPKDDAYIQRNTAEVEMSYGWQINNLKKLAVRLGTKNTLARAQSQMDDTSVGTFTAIFTKITAAEAMTLLEETNQEIQKKLDETTKDWGVTIAFIRIKPFNFSHDLNDAVSGVAEALQKKKAVISASQGEMEKRTNEGQGTANAEYDLLAARAGAERLRAEVAAMPGGATAMAIEAIQRGLETAKAVIVPENNIFGTVAGIGELLKHVPVKNPSNPSNTPAATPKQKPTQNPEPRYGSKK